MMKRLLMSIFAVFCFVTPSVANIRIDSEVVGRIIPRYFSTAKAQKSALATFNNAVKVAGDGGIAASDLWKVCAAGGLDVKKKSDKQKCEEFVYQMVKSAAITYYEVCGSDKGKSGGTEECEENLFKDIRVNMTPAVGIAQEYVRVKRNDDSLRCDKKMRTKKRDDYLRCASTDKNAFYEFRFDTLDASIDNKIKEGIKKSVCRIHDTEYGSRAVGVDRDNINDFDAGVVYKYGCGTDKESVCNEINKTMQVFGYSAKFDASGKMCELDLSSISNPEDLKNDFAEDGVNNFYFCSNAIQVTNNISFNDAIKEYLGFEVGVPESQIVCDKGFKSYTGKGCRTKWANYRDDIVSCRVGDKRVDLVFDDINEKDKTRRAGGFEGVVCLSQGGVFDATRCETFDEEHCNLLKQKLATTCTDHCEEEVRWDDTYKACILPNAQVTAKRDKFYNYALDAGIVLGAVALTVATGGTAAPGVWVVVAHVGTGMMIAGAVAKETAQAKMTWRIYEPFIEKANKCFANPKDVECAEKILKEDLQTLISYGDHFLKEEAHALDGIFAKLIERIPRDSQFWQEFINDESLWNCTDTGCTLKTKHQTWEYVSQAGDALMLIGGLMHIVSAIGTYKQTLNALNKVGGREVILKSGMGKGKNLTQLVEPVPTNNGGVWYPMVKNADLYSAGLTTIAGKGANADVVQKLLAAGVKVGDRITIAQAQKLLGVAVATTAVKTTSIMLPLLGTAIAIMPGHGGEEGEFYIALVDENTPNGNNDGGGETIVPDDTDETVDTDIVSNDTTEEVGDDNNDSGGTGSGTNSNSNTFGNIQNSLTSQWFKPNKSKNTGVLAAAAVLGTVAAGGLIGGLVVASDKKDNKSHNTDIQIDSDLENLMQKTQGSFGLVANNPLRLKTLPTVVKSNAPIVLINGQPVVLILYKSYKLPFYMHGTTWAPLLGIGEEKEFFNVYPTSENLQNNTKMTAIINALNASFNPAIVARYSGQMPGVVSFPTASTSALSIINSEFTNGVVQSQNMSDADRRLYNDNYKKIQQILK